jgi:hypothetical protein
MTNLARKSFVGSGTARAWLSAVADGSYFLSFWRTQDLRAGLLSAAPPGSVTMGARLIAALKRCATQRRPILNFYPGDYWIVPTITEASEIVARLR